MSMTKGTPASSQIITLTRLLEECETERNRLAAELDNVKQVEFPRRVERVVQVWRNKCDRLAAENAELREALEAAINYIDYLGGISLKYRIELAKHREAT